MSKKITIQEGGSSSTNAEPCDCLVKYIAVVNTTDTQAVISANLDNLYNEFVAS